MAFLEGELLDATYGTVAQRIGTLPEGLRPTREVRWLAVLIAEAQETDRPRVEQTVAVTLHPDGAVLVQGGKQHSVDSKGTMRLLQQKKVGVLQLDGIRYSLVQGDAVELHHALACDVAAPKKEEAVKHAKLGYLIGGGAG